MQFKEFYHRWQWQLKSSPEAQWPLISDSNRTDDDSRLPSLDRLPGPRPDLPGANRVRFYLFGVPLEWEEEPFEWVRPPRFGVTRRYSRGPIAEMRVLIELAPAHPLPSLEASGGGTLLTYHVWVRPKN